MSEDPMRWRDALSNVALADLPPGLGQLVRDMESPPPLPPEIRLHVRGRLQNSVTLAVPATRWVAPAVIGVAALVAGLLLWVFRPAPEPPPQPIVREPDVLGVEALQADVPPTAPDPRAEVAGGRPIALAPSGPPPVDSTGTVSVTVFGGIAAIYVDGEARGTTPLRAEVPAGDHTIEARFDNGHIARRTVLVAAGSVARVGFDAPNPLRIIPPQPISPQPEPIPTPDPVPATRVPATRAPATRVPATQRSASDLRSVVTSNRPSVLRCVERHPVTETARVEAHISIGADGRASAVGVSGGGSPALHRCVESEILTWRFPPGSSATALSVPFLFSPRDGTVVVAASPTGTGRLNVNTQPWSRVYIDGQFVGSTPLMNISLPTGTHHIRFEAEGYAPQSSRIQVEPGQTVRVVRRLSEGGRSRDEDE